ncbi:hypothetical protein ACUNG2_22495 [Serratia sp. IR-2025]
MLKIQLLDDQKPETLKKDRHHRFMHFMQRQQHLSAQPLQNKTDNSMAMCWRRRSSEQPDPPTAPPRQYNIGRRSRCT